MAKLTQKQRVIDQLNEHGFVSRNWCLSQYITRLAALVILLKGEGWELVGEERGGDYCYKVATKPPAPPRYEYHEVEREGSIIRVRVRVN